MSDREEYTHSAYKLRQLSWHSRGASLTGYGLIVGLIAIAAILAVRGVGEEVATLFGGVADQMASATVGAGGSSGGGIELMNEDCAESGSAVYDAPGSYIFLPEVSGGCMDLRVLVVGGGGGGGEKEYVSSSDMGIGGGGGSGFVVQQALTISGAVSIVVGAGGDVNESGEGSVFSVVNASGGGAGSFSIWNGSVVIGSADGGNGGSGGGGGQGMDCNALSGSGGTDGANGVNGTNGFGCNSLQGRGLGGSGAGSFGLPGLFTVSVMTAGAGGIATNMGGSGGGGVLIDGTGGNAVGGENDVSNPGAGYGGGGGGNNVSNAGGRGSDGVVYVEWGP